MHTFRRKSYCPLIPSEGSDRARAEALRKAALSEQKNSACGSAGAQSSTASRHTLLKPLHMFRLNLKSQTI